MKYSQITWDLESLYNKHKRNQLNLEAEFQRGEVWSTQKRKKLIDTIIRGWPIPPIQLLKNQDGTYEVLDGLQRVSTIIKFIGGEISIDTSFNPKGQSERLNGLDFKDICELSKSKDYENFWGKLMNRIYGFEINVYEIHEATPEEVAELFDRFNAPMVLNTVEKRNAFAGITRKQMIEVTDCFLALGASSSSLGFSNNRGSYLDLITKVCYTIEFKNTEFKISSDMLTDLYRDNYEFEDTTILRVKAAMDRLMSTIFKLEKNLKFPRASVFSLLIFLCVDRKLSSDEVKSILNILHGNVELPTNVNPDNATTIAFLQNQYDQATSFASTDVKSIKKRQYILEILSCVLLEEKFEDLDFVDNEIEFEKRAENFGYLHGI